MKKTYLLVICRGNKANIPCSPYASYIKNIPKALHIYLECFNLSNKIGLYFSTTQYLLLFLQYNYNVSKAL